MKDVLLRLCMLAYPREQRERDGAVVRDLATQLADENGTVRECGALIRAGITARMRARRFPPGVVALFGIALCLLGVGLLIAAVANAGTAVCPPGEPASSGVTADGSFVSSCGVFNPLPYLLGGGLALAVGVLLIATQIRRRRRRLA